MTTSKPGDVVGYVPLELDRYGEWITLPGAHRVDSIAKAVAWIDAFKEARQGAAMPGTYAVGKVTLAMIDRPEPLPDPSHT